MIFQWRKMLISISLQVQKQIYPILEWHDEMVQSITEAIEKIPILPTLIEQLQGQAAPYTVPTHPHR